MDQNKEGREDDDSDGTFDPLMAFVGGWFLFPLFPLFWLLLIIGIVLLARGRGGPWTGGGRETGIDVLERRFAEGELSLEQYRERRAVLEEKR